MIRSGVFAASGSMKFEILKRSIGEFEGILTKFKVFQYPTGK
jgi:hypothetical protein